MLTDAKLRSLKPAERAYKVADRDGMYVVVSPTGGISFRYNYRINGRQETLVLGSYGPDGLSLAVAREQLMKARKQVAEGVSRARLKAETIGFRKEQLRFAEWAEEWLEKYKIPMSSCRERIEGVVARAQERLESRQDKSNRLGNRFVHYRCNRIVVQPFRRTVKPAMRSLHPPRVACTSLFRGLCVQQYCSSIASALLSHIPSVTIPSLFRSCLVLLPIQFLLRGSGNDAYGHKSSTKHCSNDTRGVPAAPGGVLTHHATCSCCKAPPAPTKNVLR